MDNKTFTVPYFLFYIVFGSHWCRTVMGEVSRVEGRMCVGCGEAAVCSCQVACSVVKQSKPEPLLCSPRLLGSFKEVREK